MFLLNIPLALRANPLSAPRRAQPGAPLSPIHIIGVHTIIVGRGEGCA